MFWLLTHHKSALLSIMGHCSVRVAVCYLLTHHKGALLLILGCCSVKAVVIQLLKQHRSALSLILEHCSVRVAGITRIIFGQIWTLAYSITVMINPPILAWPLQLLQRSLTAESLRSYPRDALHSHSRQCQPLGRHIRCTGTPCSAKNCTGSSCRFALE